MGGSQGKQDVKANAKPEIKNYMDEKTSLQANLMGVDPALLAYQKQKTDKLDEHESLRNRTKDEKQVALAEQEALLQERIEKAQYDMEKAKKLRDDMGITKEEAPVPVETTVTKPELGLGIVSPRNNNQQDRSMNRQAAEIQLQNEQAGYLKNNETPASSSAKANQFNQAPIMSPNSRQKDFAEEQKMQELRRIRAEAKQADADKKQRAQEQQQQDQSSWLQSQQTPVQPVSSKIGGHGGQQKFDQDSEEEEDEDGSDNDVRRSIPGQASFQMAKAQISTIQYAAPPHARSPKNIMAPDLGNSIGRTMNSNQKVLMLGLNNEAESQEDQEAQRNRNINLMELQSLLS